VGYTHLLRAVDRMLYFGSHQQSLGEKKGKKKKKGNSNS
jgi:hypothetical protein